jgi:hypothetical protein
MIEVTARAVQNITRFIQVTGAANVGWTEAGHIRGNDFHNGSSTHWSYGGEARFFPVRMDRFYKPMWVEQAEDMAAELDETRNRLMWEMEKGWKVDRMMAEAHRRSLSEDKAVPLEVFDLEWDSER